MAIKFNDAFLAALRLIGLIFSCATLLLTAVCVYFNRYIARMMVELIDKMTGAKLKESIAFHTQRENNSKNIKYEDPVADGIIDSRATLAIANSAKGDTWSFLRADRETPKGLLEKLSPDTLIAKTRQLLSPAAELGLKRPDLLADDFQFVFPFVGPLNKEEYCAALSNLNFSKAFPSKAGSRKNYFGFTVDPTEPNRVWFFMRSLLVHGADLRLGRLQISKTMKKVESTPQVCSFSFDHEGKCYKFTGGYPVDRTSGNCSGLGGLFGIVHCLKPGSFPFPEGRPWEPSLEWQIWYNRVPQFSVEWNNILGALGW